MPEAFTTLFLIAAAGVLVFAYRAARRRRKAWEEAIATVAARLGLRYERGGLMSRGRAEGAFEGILVTIDSYTQRSGKSSSTYTRIRVGPSRLLIRELRAESFTSSIKKAIVGEDLRTGDESFDRMVGIRGDEEAVLGLLDVNTRRLVSSAIVNGVSLKDDTLYWRRSELARDPEEMEEVARDMAAIASRFEVGEEKHAARLLMDNAVNDPLDEVRDRNLEVLLSQFGGSVEAMRAAENVGRDRDPDLQVAAAQALGQGGLERLAELALEEGLTPGSRGRAIEALAEDFGDSSVTRETLLAVADRSADPNLALALTLTRRLGIQVPLEVLAARTDHPYRAGLVCLARAIGDHVDPRSQPLLLDMLETNREHDDMVVAVVEALGNVGDRHAVAPLIPLTKGIFTDGEVKRVARAAVQSIQARLGAADGGRLSVVEGATGGGLAITEEAGGLSVAEPSDLDGQGAAERDEIEQPH